MTARERQHINDHRAGGHSRRRRTTCPLCIAALGTAGLELTISRHNLKTTPDYGSVRLALIELARKP